GSVCGVHPGEMTCRRSGVAMLGFRPGVAGVWLGRCVRGGEMWIRRLVRGWGWGRNPLRRTTDRVEAWLTLVLVVAMLVIAPWAGSRAAHAAYRDTVRMAAWQAQHRFPVEAVVLQDVRGDSVGDK